jgi:hypothetical protein
MKNKSDLKEMAKELGFATLVALGVFSLVVLIIIIECLIFGG